MNTIIEIFKATFSDKRLFWFKPNELLYLVKIKLPNIYREEIKKDISQRSVKLLKTMIYHTHFSVYNNKPIIISPCIDISKLKSNKWETSLIYYYYPQ